MDTSANVRRDVPLPSENLRHGWGSDALATMLRVLEVPYVVVNPGSSFRGLHDSIVNYLGNERPQMLLVLHEEHAVAIAHGYAKVAEKPLAAIVHSNVGLMHASMAIYNAWCDRVPVLVYGATGPVDAAKRRPWIDWLHTSQDQGALVRSFVKWDAQPASIDAAREAMLRANQISRSSPKGPTYVCFDSAIQEAEVDGQVRLPDVARFAPAAPVWPAPADVRAAAELLQGAGRVVVLVGRVSRQQADWDHRVRLVESIGAVVLTDLKLGAAFPTRHPAHANSAGYFLSAEGCDILRSADVVLSLDWCDLGGTLRQAWGPTSVSAKVIQVSTDHQLHNGWSFDHQALPSTDLFLAVEPREAVAALLEQLPAGPAKALVPRPASADVDPPAAAALHVADVARGLRQVLENVPTTFVRLPLSWSGELWDWDSPLDYIGYDGGGGIGSGPGMAVGAALALMDSGRVPVAILGDGDYMMGVSAFWTAANARIPLLAVICNNRSFFNDELHQERVAVERGRPIENKGIGQRIEDPDLDLAMIARGQGLVGFGPITSWPELISALQEGLNAVRDGKAVVIDVRVMPGYSPSMSRQMIRDVAAE